MSDMMLFSVICLTMVVSLLGLMKLLSWYLPAPNSQAEEEEDEPEYEWGPINFSGPISDELLKEQDEMNARFPRPRFGPGQPDFGDWTPADLTADDDNSGPRYTH